MSSPEKIYLDARVLRTIATDPEGLAEPVGYVLEEVVAQKLAELREMEFVIQFEITQEGGIIGLTNLGKILIHERGRWIDPEDPGG